MNEYEYITQEGLEKLKKELDELRSVKRQEIVRRIERAKELGDLSENSEYQEAKESQAANEARIAELEELVRRAVIITRSQTGVAEIGSTITAKNDGTVEKYTIVGSEEANPRGGKISNESPIGKAFLKKKVGDKVDLETPSGVRKYTIIKVE